MIVDFTLENFRSIKTSQLFSLYAENKPKHHSNNIHFAEQGLGVLKTAAIYGPNAAGKTNLLLAFRALSTLIVESEHWKEGDSIALYQPYLLSDSCLHSDTCFEIEFIVTQTRYRYAIRFNKAEITFEKLEVFKTAKPSMLFQREVVAGEHAIKLGEAFRGGKRSHGFFNSQAYLSVAGNSPDSPEFIREIYQYFYRGIVILEKGAHDNLIDWQQRSEVRDFVNAFLSKADFGIDSVDIVEKTLPDKFNVLQDLPDGARQQFLNRLGQHELVFYHKNESGELVEFPLHLESHGTRSVLKFIPSVAMVLLTGRTLMIDEIEASLHPHIAELVIKLFNDPVVNPLGAQLIYTTHDLTLMAQDKHRKDQIYLACKSHSEGTELLSLDDFNSDLRDSSPFSKWYNEGRLGGIPEIHYKDIAATIKGSVDNAQAKEW